MNSGAKQRNDRDGQPLPKPDNDTENHHITERLPEGYSNPNSNPQAVATPNRAVMWAGPAPSGAGARSEGPKAYSHQGGGEASSVTGGSAVWLPHPPGAGLAPPVPLPAVTPLPSVDSQAIQNGVAKTFGSAANDDEAVQTASTSVHDEVRLTDADAFAIVKAARQMLVDNEDRRRVRKDTPASEASIRNYLKKCRQIEAELEEVDPGSPAPLFEVMVRYSDRKQTFQALKSALRWQAWTQLQSVMRDQDRLQRAGKRDDTWKRLVLQVQRWQRRLQAVDALNRSECLFWLDKSPRRSRSKRQILHRLEDNWRQRFMDVNLSSAKYRHAGVLLVHCGLRPAELARGVRVRWTPKGVRVLIAGAKVRATAGQPWRAFLLNPSQLPEWFVNDLRNRRRMVIAADEDALRAHLYRQSQAVLNPGDKKQNRDLVLSSYLFRHALVTDMRESAWDTEDIAASIGESSAETLRYYGTRRNSGSRKVKPTVAMVMNSVRTPRAVKPIDQRGLNVQLKKQKRSGRLPGPKP